MAAPNWTGYWNGRSRKRGKPSMGHTFAIRGAAGVVSTALALSIGAPAASAGPPDRTSSAPAAAARTSSGPAASGQSGVSDRGYSPISPFSPDPCSPFSWTLKICADGASYSVPNASNTPSPRPTPARVVTHSSDFDWSEAAIGAATLVLLAIGIGGIRTATNKRTRHAATS
jgi:hypothetical protein